MVKFEYFSQAKPQVLNGLFAFLFSTLMLIAHPAMAQDQQLIAEVDRNPIAENETVTLTVTLVGGSSNAPDFSDLNYDFQILNQNQSSQFSMSNGKSQRSVSWTLSLLPRRSGRLQIPGFRIGAVTSRAIELKVNPAGSQAGTKSSKEAFLEIEVAEQAVYVQQQIPYRVRLFMSSRVSGGSLTSPEVPGAIIEAVGEQSNYEQLIDGRRWRVVERRYLIIPESSGPLTIDGPLFSGELTNQNRRRSIFDIMPSAGKPYHSKAKSVQLEVLPQPASYTGKHWLPARNLILREEWVPNPPEFKVGEPVTRVLKLEALGLLGTQLPSIEFPESDGLRSYPDADEAGNEIGSNGVTGTRTLRAALIPERAGEIILPAIKLAWWDTDSNKQRIARIPPRRIQVAASAVQSSAPNAATLTPENSPQPTSSEHDDTLILTPKTEIRNNQVWIIISAFLATGWLLTVLAWLIRSRSKNPKRSANSNDAEQHDSLRVVRNKLTLACKENNAEAIHNQLLAWKALALPNSSKHGFSDLISEIDDAAFTENINALLRARWHCDGHFDADAILRAIQQWSPKRPIKPRSQTLPDLYPS